LKYYSICKKKNDIGGKRRMIKLIEKQKIIITYLRKGKSQRQIARQMGLNRRTIAKYIKGYETKKPAYRL